MLAFAASNLFDNAPWQVTQADFSWLWLVHQFSDA
jgi:hypothetical protein